MDRELHDDLPELSDGRLRYMDGHLVASGADETIRLAIGEADLRAWMQRLLLLAEPTDSPLATTPMRQAASLLHEHLVPSPDAGPDPRGR